MEDKKPQPFDTFQELIHALIKRKGVISNMPESIPVSQEELDMYISYTWPATEDNPNPVIPPVDEITMNGYKLLKVDADTLAQVKEELKAKE